MKTVLDINGKFYEMEENKAIEILKFGKEKLNCGIYGVYKEGYARALLEKHNNEEELNKAIANYEFKGFTVLYNK
jgi:hypothetical protein